MTASFVLTFQGIEFLLDSKQSGATIAFDHANSSNEEILLTLNNFTGNLRVSTSTSPSSETSSPSSSKTSTTPTTTGRVSLSPEHRPAQSKSKPKTTRRPQPPATTKKTKVTTSRPATSTSNNDASTDDETTSHKRRVVSCEEDSLPSCSKKGKHHETIDAPTATPSTHDNNTTSDSITPNESTTHKISPDARKQQASPSTILIPSSSSSSSSCSVVSVPTIGSDNSLARLPSARWGHTMSWIDDNTKILVYGGQTLNDNNDMLQPGMTPTTTHGDLYVYDTLTNEFSKPVHCEGVERQWHSSVYLAERQLLIAFGGEAPTGNKGKMETLNQVMVLDTEIMLWYPPTVTGEIPAGRSGHSASILGSSNDKNHLSMVLFGGVGKGNKYQRTVSVLDTVRWKWTTCTKIVGDAPRPRSYHTATSIAVQQPQKQLDGVNQNNAVTTTKDWIVIIGGNDHDRCFNSVHVLEVRGDCWSWINPIVSGDIPAPRTGHVAVLMEDGKTIFVHGGWDPNAEDEDQEVIFNDCFLLDTTTWVWTKLDQTVPARVGHRAVQCKGGVEIFGGRLEGGKFSNALLKVNVDL